MRKLIPVCMLIAAALILSSAFRADAIPNQDKTNVYYSDATFTKAVGEKLVLSCYGRSGAMIWGKTSNHYKVQSSPCEGGGMPTTKCISCDRNGLACQVVFPCH